MRRVKLRALAPADVPRLFRCVNDPRVSRHQVSFRVPLSFDDERDFYVKMRKSPTDRVLSFTTERGRWLGTLGLHGIDWVDRCCELGVLVADPKDWSKGWAAAAIRRGVAFAFDTLHLHRLEVPLLARHQVARAMYERLGFFPEAVLRERRFVDGAYEDVVVLSLLATD